MSQPAATPKLPGETMLKVVSILFIVFGGISFIVSLIALIGSGLVASYSAAVGAMLVVASIIALISSVLYIVMGIIGLKKCSSASQAMYFIVVGIILCALNLVSLIMSFSAVSLIGFVLPILYIVGGFMNKKAAA